MAPRRPAGLAERLAPHLPQRFDPGVYAWWPGRAALRPPAGRLRRGPFGRRGRPAGTRRRTAQLAQVVERLATLLAAGHDLRAAVAHIVTTGHGPVVAELAPVDAHLAAGVPAASAIRSWAQRVACPHVAQLAVDLRGCADVDAMTVVVERRARVLRHEALRDQLGALRLRAAVTWFAGVISCAVTVAAVVA